MRRGRAERHGCFQALAAIFRALRIDAIERFTLSASASPAAPPAVPRRPPPALPDVVRQRLLMDLRDALYARCFARPFGAGPPPSRDAGPALDPQDLARRLSAANHGHDAWIAGWRVEEAGGSGSVVLTRGGSRHSAGPGEYAMTFYEDMPPLSGGAATLLHRRESFTLQAGVYYAFGALLPEPEDEAEVLRIYFHAAQQSAVPVFELLTAELDALEVPFTLKTMLQAADRDRCDATVLYLPRRRYPAFAGLGGKLANRLGASLARATPLFTKQLHTGVGLAESPSGSESFGMLRCRLVAEGIVDAWASGRQDVASRLASTERSFAAAGLSLRRPYLGAGGKDTYAPFAAAREPACS
jgi:hypothetical protein